MLLLSDLHLREETADIVLGKVLPGIRAVARERDDRHIGILGDILHFRYHVPVRLLNGLRDELREGDRLKYTIIPGNHDQVDVAGRNALEHLDDLEHVEVFTQPQWRGNALWFPYRKLELVEGLLREVMSQAGSSTGKLVLFIHHGIKGAWMNDGMQDRDGLPADLTLLSVFDRVICGHYHMHQHVSPKVSYVGSPYQTRADEAGQPKGYCVWDGTNLTQIQMHWGRRFHKIVPVNGEVDMEGVQPGDEVRIEASTKAEAEGFGKILAELGVTHIVTVKDEALQARLDVKEGSGFEDFAHAYVEAELTELDKGRLLETFKQITVP